MSDTKTKLKALARFKELRAEADAIDYSWDETEKFKEWKLAVEAALRKLFSEASPYLKEFVSASVAGVGYGDFGSDITTTKGTVS